MKKDFKSIELRVKSKKVDVQSRFSDSNLEYVSLEEVYQVDNLFDSWNEYNNERKEQ
jgi:hypothetical protein